MASSFLKWSSTAFLSRIRNHLRTLPDVVNSALAQPSTATDSSLSSSSLSTSFSSLLSLSSTTSHGTADLSDIEDLRRIFDHFDENKDGSVSLDELRRSLQMFGIQTEDAELVAMVEGADTNGDGLLDFGEFVSFYYDLNEGMSRKISASTATPYYSQEEGDMAAAKGVDESATCIDDAYDAAAENTEEDEERSLRDAFELFDKNGDGFICAEELQSVLKSMGLKQGKLLADCKDMIRFVDVDGDGQVSFHEFKQMMQLDIIR